MEKSVEIDRAAAERAIEAFLRALGQESTSNPELRGTGARVAAAWAEELLSGYQEDPVSFLKQECIPATKEHRNGQAPLVILRAVDVALMCPHHLMPSLGTATLVYDPSETLVGLGALVRLLRILSRRLTLQETVTQEVVSALMDPEALGARGAYCHLRLLHGCMAARGEREHAWVDTTLGAGTLSNQGPRFGEMSLALLSTGGRNP